MVYVRVVADVLIVANWVANFVLTSPPPAVAAVARPSIEVLRAPAAVQTCPAQVVCSIVGGVPEPVAEEGDVEAVVVLEVREHAVNRTARANRASHFFIGAFLVSRPSVSSRH